MPTYADIILPLALPKRTYTYSVPESVAALVQIGVRVEVQFGKSKLMSHEKFKTFSFSKKIDICPSL
ncbi:MAG: hypothetical protein ACKVU0_11295 [Saprospiraceae bacterium]